MKVKKAVIPAAGLGTRFLPATKAMAKEMLPIVDKPTIQFIVEEALASGIEDILIVTGKAKRPIEDHFDSNVELENNLKEKNKTDLLKLVEEKVPLTKQLMDDYEETHASTIAVMKVPHEDTSKYGIINPEKEIEKGLYNVENFVEKPKPEEAPSDLAIIGRYLLTPEIFDVLENQKPGAGNEIQLTDAIDTLNKTQRVFAREFKGERYDVGDKFGFMKTSIEYGLTHPEVKDNLREYIINLGAQLAKKEQPKEK